MPEDVLKVVSETPCLYAWLSCLYNYEDLENKEARP